MLHYSDNISIILSHRGINTSEELKLLNRETEGLFHTEEDVMSNLLSKSVEVFLVLNLIIIMTYLSTVF